MADDATRQAVIQGLLGKNVLAEKKDIPKTSTNTLYNKSIKIVEENKKDLLVEKLAELEHEQWMFWAKEILKTEKISPARAKRWEENSFMPYEDLSEEQKEFDREWAYKVLKIIGGSNTDSVKENLVQVEGGGRTSDITDLSKAFEQVLERKTTDCVESISNIREKLLENIREDMIESMF